MKGKLVPWPSPPKSIREMTTEELHQWFDDVHEEFWGRSEHSMEFNRLLAERVPLDEELKWTRDYYRNKEITPPNSPMDPITQVISETREDMESINTVYIDRVSITECEPEVTTLTGAMYNPRIREDV